MSASPGRSPRFRDGAGGHGWSPVTSLIQCRSNGTGHGGGDSGRSGSRKPRNPSGGPFRPRSLGSRSFFLPATARTRVRRRELRGALQPSQSFGRERAVLEDPLEGPLGGDDEARGTRRSLPDVGHVLAERIPVMVADETPAAVERPRVEPRGSREIESGDFDRVGGIDLAREDRRFQEIGFGEVPGGHGRLEHELAPGERPGLVRADHGRRAEGFDARDAADEHAPARDATRRARGRGEDERKLGAGGHGDADAETKALAKSDRATTPEEDPPATTAAARPARPTKGPFSLIGVRSAVAPATSCAIFPLVRDPWKTRRRRPVLRECASPRRTAHPGFVVRHGLTGQHRLVGGEIRRPGDLAVRMEDVPFPQQEHVAGNDSFGTHGFVAQDARGGETPRELLQRLAPRSRTRRPPPGRSPPGGRSRGCPATKEARPRRA